LKLLDKYNKKWAQKLQVQYFIVLQAEWVKQIKNFFVVIFFL